MFVHHDLFTVQQMSRSSLEIYRQSHAMNTVSSPKLLGKCYFYQPASVTATHGYSQAPASETYTPLTKTMRSGALPPSPTEGVGSTAKPPIGGAVFTGI